MKRGLLLTSILLISLVSAQSLSEFLNEIDPSNVFLIAIFLITFALLSFVLKRAIKSDPKIPLIIAFIVSLLITYTLNRVYWFQDLMYNFYFTSPNLSFGQANLQSYLIGTIIVLVILSFVSARLKKKVNLDWEEFIIGQITSYVLVIIGITMIYDSPIYRELTTKNLVSLALIVLGILVLMFYTPKNK
jgi:CDP-diglyceride synthetase